MVINRHERTLNASSQTVGNLLNNLSSGQDQLWPYQKGWPPMKFDRPLQVGAIGGHGPIGYNVVQFTPSQKIVFQFTNPQGLVGRHYFYLEEITANQTRVIHLLEAKLEGGMWLAWTFLFRPMHDALVEDALDNGQTLFEPNIKRKNWSLYVRFLRFVMRIIRQANSKNTKTASVKNELK